MTTSDKLWLGLIKFGISIPSTFAGGLVLSYYWAWFIVEAASRRGYVLGSMGVGEGAGVILFLGALKFVTVGSTPVQENPDDELSEKIVEAVVSPIVLYPMLLAIGKSFYEILY